MKIIFSFIAILLFGTTWSQPTNFDTDHVFPKKSKMDFGYDKKEVSIKARKIIKHFKKADCVESEFLGRMAERSDLYPYYELLRVSASIEDLSELCNHPNNVTRAYAFMALLELNVDSSILRNVISNHVYDSSIVQFFGGCNLSNKQLNQFMFYSAINDDDRDSASQMPLYSRYQLDRKIFYNSKKSIEVLQKFKGKAWAINGIPGEDSLNLIEISDTTTITEHGIEITHFYVPAKILNESGQLTDYHFLISKAVKGGIITTIDFYYQQLIIVINDDSNEDKIFIYNVIEQSEDSLKLRLEKSKL